MFDLQTLIKQSTKYSALGCQTNQNWRSSETR